LWSGLWTGLLAALLILASTACTDDSVPQVNLDANNGGNNATNNTTNNGGTNSVTNNGGTNSVTNNGGTNNVTNNGGTNNVTNNGITNNTTNNGGTNNATNNGGAVCVVDGECADGEFCARASGTCGIEGTCTVRPQDCDDTYAPVCGCDGQTYRNDCVRGRAGASLASDAACATQTGCTANAGCAATDFCELGAGTCIADAPEGTCEPRPDACERILRPVCGCDGLTYGNDCERQRAGVPLDHGGRCDAVPNACDTNLDCAADEVCLCQGACGTSGACAPVQDCSLEVAPVCGCDGRTYENDCRRQQAGTCLAHEGRCGALTCGGANGRLCGDGQVCDTPIGVCSNGTALGACVEVPARCDGLVAPVCGCDGTTYTNDCERLRAGVELQSTGPCADPTACRTDRDCAARDLYCEFAADSCGELDRVGACTFAPRFCEPVVAPVCGCDGQTYVNDCLRMQARAPLAHAGACDGSALCLTNRDCAGTDYCDCTLACGSPGECLPRPTTCPDLVDPVCGCDGVTYGNDCERQLAGVCLGSAGACEVVQTCGGVANVCPRGQFCDPNAGICAALDPPGVCVEVPTVCERIYLPVCGCDGVTYGNDCERVRAQVGKASDGACGTTRACASDLECNRREFCDFAAGTCGMGDGLGQCTPRIGICDGNLSDPVCGCDDVTYDNDCLRIAAGVSLLHGGACVVQVTCDTNADCVLGEFCACSGACGAAGVCEARPNVCPDVRQPTCGCDGVTYPSDCFRQAAGTCFAHFGTCESTVTCTPGGAECGRGQFCDINAGQCAGGLDVVGQCVSQIDFCPDVLDPVCGCDGVTYDNDCLRRHAGVYLAQTGPCAVDPPRSCTGDQRDCGRGSFCDLDPGTCDAAPADRRGECVAVEPVCGRIYDPVCGCDSVTYANDCLRINAGADLAYQGACQVSEGCLSDRDCLRSQFCEHTVGSCASLSDRGVCVDVPALCDGGVDAPVCGCDLQTYDNDCTRRQARVSASASGVCR